ncbi:SUMF1/EgtB/PvdO family nonheme iron enzyme [Labilithrix luteola]|uniref:SUMF1/EgtB/PvdO family nonheme iron enzyme n=1 Tax=Labilithrix luteola TaxID=1391654 RepID=UPI0011BA92A7|nr:SUMF1/EgtB/PvdO family nonheme iron enzyme [Labilithrix luteola]
MKNPHPAWLNKAFVSACVGATAAALLGAVGCARLGGDLVRSPLGARVFAAKQVTASLERVAHGGPENVELTSAAIAPRLAFIAPADVPVEQLLPEGDRPLPMNGLCPPDMASIDDRFCVDKYEASLVEVLGDGREQAWPYYLPVEGHRVRAVSEKGAYPQGYISEKQAIEACRGSGKRLCKPAEWRKACQGPDPKKFGYANERTPGTCNDQGRSPVGFFYGADVATGKAWTWDKMNDPQLNQLPGTLAETGSHEDCSNGYGVYDMVGNIHEWVDDPAGTFQGGYYLDVTQNGDGCGYRTDAHEAWYHDYSTGFRCCADVAQ